MASTHLPPQWKQRLLAVVNAHGWDAGQFAAQTLRFLDAWQRAEGGNAAWNPLNTTLHIPGWCSSPDYNSTGVANYTKPTYGVMATAATLVSGLYNGILGALQGGTLTAEEIVNKNWDELKTWGTDPNVILNVLAGS